MIFRKISGRMHRLGVIDRVGDRQQPQRPLGVDARRGAVVRSVEGHPAPSGRPAQPGLGVAVRPAPGAEVPVAEPDRAHVVDPADPVATGDRVGDLRTRLVIRHAGLDDLGEVSKKPLERNSGSSSPVISPIIASRGTPAHSAAAWFTNSSRKSSRRPSRSRIAARDRDRLVDRVEQGEQARVEAGLGSSRSGES